MLSDYKPQSATPQLSVTSRKSIKVFLEFLEEKLSRFPEQLDKDVLSEDQISQDLYIFLERESRFSNQAFMFTFQYKYKRSRRSVDIGVVNAQLYSTKDTIFVIESKRLPTSPPKEREKEYVLGNLGGIERFKKGHHGKGVNSSAILGYIQKEDFDHWFKNINLWIKEEIKKDKEGIWDKEDLLVKIQVDPSLARFTSTCKRINDNNINLYHYFIKI